MNLNQVTSFFIPDYTVDLRISLSQLSLVDCHHRSGIGFFQTAPCPERMFSILEIDSTPFFVNLPDVFAGISMRNVRWILYFELLGIFLFCGVISSDYN